MGNDVHILADHFWMKQIPVPPTNAFINKIECGKRIEAVIANDNLLKVRSLIVTELENDTEERDGSQKSILSTLGRIVTKLFKNPQNDCIVPKTVLMGTSSLVWMLAYGLEKKAFIRENPELLLEFLDIQPEYFRKERISSWRSRLLDTEEEETIDEHLNYACENFLRKDEKVVWWIRPDCFYVKNEIVRLSSQWTRLSNIPDIILRIQTLYDDHKNGLS